MALRAVSVGVLCLLLAAACGPTPDPEATGGNGGQGASGGNGPGGSGAGGSGGDAPYPPADAFDPAYDAYFDPPAAGAYKDDYRVVGEITPDEYARRCSRTRPTPALAGGSR